MAPGGELFEQIPAGALEMHVPRPAESDALGFEQQLLVGPVRGRAAPGIHHAPGGQVVIVRQACQGSRDQPEMVRKPDEPCDHAVSRDLPLGNLPHDIVDFGEEVFGEFQDAEITRTGGHAKSDLQVCRFWIFKGNRISILLLIKELTTR